MGRTRTAPFLLSSKWLSLLLCGVLIACGGGEADKKKEDGISSGKEKADTTAQRKVKKSYHQVPTPDRILSIISGFDQKPDPELLLDPSKAEGLVAKEEQAIHLGIYTTDLAYATVFGMQEEALSYFRTVRDLAERSGVSSAFDEETLKRLKKGVGDRDSLQNISRDTYLEAFDYLERNGRGETLALLVGGGWTESLYLTVQMLKEYEKGDPLVQYVADQYYSLKQLQSFLKRYEEHESVANLMDSLKSLEEAYSGLERQKKGKSQMSQKEGEMVLTGGTELKMEASDLKRIRRSIVELRTDLTDRTAPKKSGS